MAPFDFKLADVDDLHNVGMVDVGKNFVFTVEELQSLRIGDIQQGLDGNLAPQDGVEGLVDHSHSAPAQDFLDLISPFDQSLECPLLSIRPDEMMLPLFAGGNKNANAAGLRLMCRSRPASYTQSQIQDSRRLKWGNVPLPTAAQGEPRRVSEGVPAGSAQFWLRESGCVYTPGGQDGRMEILIKRPAPASGR